MTAKYFGKISFIKAKHFEETAWERTKAGLGDHVLGFELEPVVTLGSRGSFEQDLLWPESKWKEQGFVIEQAERGGQATLHNPGQLVIFPIINIREIGVKNFVRLLAAATQNFLRENGCEAGWDECKPGLYTKAGKVVSMGIRIRQGISSHGIAINVHNDLLPFQGIRVCGGEAAVDRLRTDAPLSELFLSWNQAFTALLTRPLRSHNLEPRKSSGACSSVG